MTKTSYEKRHHGLSPAEEGELAAKREEMAILEEQINKLSTKKKDNEEARRAKFEKFCESKSIRSQAATFVLIQEELMHKGLRVSDWSNPESRPEIEIEIEDTVDGFRTWIKVERQ